ncbi:gliding motility-associated C-terminal domain-containing protein [Chitinophaga sp. Cy-1792]|uniref:T9SS type B sorting domain-containing protein n=1 Tax=Chitinophaga sp. Cy-1792 TaxID=2608339 RepID=UPI0014201877|nr:gliding motility-associated C-terminal domain-containing protein [Chitinophaga sp. Cy-1792]
MKALTAIVVIALFYCHTVSAQDIGIANPSIEGPPRAGNVPYPWLRFRSPDTQPGFYGISLAPSDGKTYAGFINGHRWEEGILQLLPTPMQSGTTYQLSFDLAAPVHYDTLLLCSGALAVYGSFNETDPGDLLWQSGTFVHPFWQRYTATISPKKNYPFLVLMPYLPGSCPGNGYAGALLDNISPTLAEVPQLSLQVQPTCAGKKTGAVKAIASGGKPPYSYSWDSTTLKSDYISGLGTGSFTVTVTGANGATVRATAYITDYSLRVQAVPDLPFCHGDANGSFTLKPATGVPPYHFQWQGGSFQPDSVISGLRAGTYNFAVQDAVGCSMSSTATLNEPDALQITTVKKHDVSCTETMDGKIQLSINGGTRPYSFSLQSASWQPDSVWAGLDAGSYRYDVKDVNGCEVSGSQEIIRYIRECAVFMPNAFSPNGDGVNDIFRARVNDDVKDFRLAVYSRWGEMVFETRDPEMGWDGTIRGRKAQLEVFAWVLTYTDSHQQARKQTGSVTLIR